MRPRDLDEVRAPLRLRARARPAPDLPHRRHVALRPGGDRRHPRGAGALLEELPRPRRGRAGVWTQPGVVGGYLNRVLAPLRPPPRARSRVDRRRHDRRHRRQQLLRHVLRRRPEQLPHAGRRSTFVLADGTVVDTARPDADERAAPRRGPTCTRALLAPARRGARATRRWPRASAGEVRAQEHDRLQPQRASSTTTRPAEILAHLMVGLAGHARLRGRRDAAHGARAARAAPPRSSTSPSCAEAGAAVAPLAAAGAAALEIMDAASLRSQAGDRALSVRDRRPHGGAPGRVPRADDADALDAAVRARAARRSRAVPPAGARPASRRDPAERDAALAACARACSPRWAGMRPSGHGGGDRGRGGPGRAAGRGHRRPAARSSTATASRTRSSSATPATATCTSCSRRTSPTPRRCAATTRSCASWSTSWWGSTTARSRPSTGRAATWRRSCATSGATRPTR